MAELKPSKKKRTPLHSSADWKFPPVLKQRPVIAKVPHVTILGCGTSSGSPILACRCKTCLSKDVRNQRQRASVCISVNGKNFLIDTSPDLRMQALQNKLYWIDAVLYTHPHADHLHGFDDLRTFNYLMGKSIPAYGNSWSLKEIRTKFSYAFEKGQDGGGKPHVDLYLMEKAEMISGIKVTPLPLIHGELPVLGFRIKDIAYITDCSKVLEPTFRSLRNLDVLVLDCLRYQKHPTHLNVEEALALAARIGAKRTYLTHMGHDIEYRTFAKALPKGIYPAYDGLVIKSQ